MSLKNFLSRALAALMVGGAKPFKPSDEIILNGQAVKEVMLFKEKHTNKDDEYWTKTDHNSSP